MRSGKYILFLTFLFASIGPISSTLYLPSLPIITNNFHTTTALAQLTIALFVLGYCIARLTFSTVSDAFGRKIPLTIGLLICLVGSSVCFYSTNIDYLLVGRFLQGLGGGGSNVLARVILRDKVESTKLAQYSSYYSMANILAMISAPLMGAYLQYYFGWKSICIALILYNVIALIASIFTLPETNSHLNYNSIRPAIIRTNLKTLFVNKEFIIYAILLMLAYGNTTAWLTSGPIILQEVLSLTPVKFGWCASIVGFSYFIGAYINSKIVGAFGIRNMLHFGVGCLFVSGVFMLIPILFFNYLNIIVFVAPVIIAVFGSSMLVPNAYAAGLTSYSKIAGIAVGILASLQVLGGVLSSIIISLTPERNQLPLGLVFLISGLICILLMLYLKIVSPGKR